MAIERQPRADRWDDDSEHGWAAERGGNSAGGSARAAAQARRPLTREEAQALRAREKALSPWRVVAAQAALGAAAALLAALLWSRGVGWSVLYGAATAVVPGALMARGMTSRLSRMSPGAGAVSFMSWEAVKIGVSVAMLVLAPKLVQPLSWPALLAGMVLCIKVYWLALLWRGRGGKKN